MVFFMCAMPSCSSGTDSFRTANFCCRIVDSSVPTGASSGSHLARKRGLSRAVRPLPKRPLAGNTRFKVLTKRCTWLSVLTAVALYRHGVVFKLSSFVASFFFAQVQPKANPPLPKALQKLHLEVSRQLAVSTETVRSISSPKLRYDQILTFETWVGAQAMLCIYLIPLCFRYTW